MASQSQPGYLAKVEVRDETLAHFELYVSPDALTFIKIQPGTTGIGALWTALLGDAIYGRLRRKTYGDDMTLQEKLAASKGSFAVPSSAVVSLKFSKVIGHYDLRIDFQSDGGVTKSRLMMSKQSYEVLYDALQKLQAFRSKVIQ